MKTKVITLVLLAFIGWSKLQAQVGIGTPTPDPSSVLDVDVTSLPANAKKGFLPPRMTTAQRNAINSAGTPPGPAEGLTIYNTDNDCIEFWNGASWISLCTGGPTTVPNPCDPTNPTAVVDVTNAFTGKTWMDRNLGASQQATASNDFLAYGSLYQWGRGSDGHQCINWTSSTGSDGTEQDNETPITVTSATPGHGDFITATSATDFNWTNFAGENDLWQGVNGINNPCPSGYRVPTEAEWLAEIDSWDGTMGDGWDGTNGINDAINSTLKLPGAGYRNANAGLLLDVGSFGNYWSSSVNGTLAWRLTFDSEDSSTASSSRAQGNSVRCIKE